MAYFANGTEGIDYQMHYCERCIHWSDENGCPVWDVHLFFAYDLCNEEDHPGKIILDMLIPENEDGFAEQCKMFTEKK